MTGNRTNKGRRGGNRKPARVGHVGQAYLDALATKAERERRTTAQHRHDAATAMARIAGAGRVERQSR